MSATSKYASLVGTSKSEKLLIEIIRALDSMDINLGDINIDVTSVENLLQGVGGASETPAASRNADTNNTVAAGAFSVSFSNTGAVNCTVAGATLEPGETFEWAAKAGNTLGDIVWIATGATAELVILETR
jgi:hypothetical protein